MFCHAEEVPDRRKGMSNTAEVLRDDLVQGGLGISEDGGLLHVFSQKHYLQRTYPHARHCARLSMCPLTTGAVILTFLSFMHEETSGERTGSLSPT